MTRLLRCAGFGLAAIIMAILASASPARAHGTQDQSLMFDPGCLTTSLRASASSVSSLRQEFVPALTGLHGVDICVTVTSGSSLVNVQVRTGTAAAPGAVIASASSSVPSGTRWVHFELAQPIPLTPGLAYVIEVGGFPAFSWRGTCGQVAAPDCPSADPDLYAGGVSNAGPTIGDFAFRTFDPGDTDLDGMPDGYELAHACLDRLIADAGGDPDSDGVSSGTERTLGSDPCVPALDSDGDGCTDAEENGAQHVKGGQRDPGNAWDFYDVTFNRTIDLSDTLNVLSYFGANGSGASNLRDRFVPDVNFPWRTAEATNGIDLVDALANLRSFGDNCVAPP